MPALENRHRWAYHHLLYSIALLRSSKAFTAHLGEVGEIEAQMLNKPQMLIEVRMFKFSTSAPILANPC